MAQGNRYIAPELKTEYLEWLMTPPGEREPPTKEAMALHLGVSSRTFYNWESEPHFQEKLRSLKLEWGSRWYPDILARLMDVVMNGPPAQSVGAAKVLLSHIEIKDEKAGDLPEMEKELLKKMTAILKELNYEVIGE
jgi:hypothetical protein